MLVMSTNSINYLVSGVDWNKAFFNAENAVVWMAQTAFDLNPSAGLQQLLLHRARNPAALAKSFRPPMEMSTSRARGCKSCNPAAAMSNVFVITASAQGERHIRTIQAQITLRPVSQVFDYEYFLNNWGWWWGSTITGNGAQRANWDFDFRGGPTVNGSIYAADQVDENEVPIQYYATPPFGGLAGADETNLVHQGAPRVTMPNLLNFSNYIATAWPIPAPTAFGSAPTKLSPARLTNHYTPNPGGNGGNLTPQTGLYVVGTPSLADHRQRHGRYPW